MANYRVNADKKQITVGANLTAAEKEIVKIYAEQGYKLVPSKSKGEKRITKAAMVKWLAKDGHEDKKKFFDAAMEKGGFLVAMKEFRNSFANEADKKAALDEIKKLVK